MWRDCLRGETQSRTFHDHNVIRLSIRMAKRSEVSQPKDRDACMHEMTTRTRTLNFCKPSKRLRIHHIQRTLQYHTMKSFQSILLALALLVSSVGAFGVTSASMSLAGASGGSSFVVSQRQRSVVQQPSRAGKSDLQMGSMAKFGIFSPAVLVAKIGLGSDKLNKIRGKAISLHSQYIGEFCLWAGAYHLRTRLIKKAKTNGDILGFLV
jgi:hypothetical protein